MYKIAPDEYKGACKASHILNLIEEEHGHNYWKTHGFLLELTENGHLEQKRGSGFRYKR